jgi:hypothetical protein
LDDSYSGQVKKQKSSGVGAMGQIANGLNSIATAFGKETVAIQESVSMSLVGQASQIVQGETCLQPEGILVMLDILADNPMKVTTYLSMEKNQDLRWK